jgi:hypothetical protein
MSLFPVNFMKYFSEQPSVRRGNIQDIHLPTESSAFRFLRHDREDCQHLNYNVDDHICHCRSRRDAGVYLKPAEETFDSVKDVDKLVLASARIFSRLGSVSK